MNILGENDYRQPPPVSPFLAELCYWGPVLGWGLFIWIFSTRGFSESGTSRWIVPLLHWLLPHAPPRTLFRIHHMVRKGAHAFEYFLLSLLLLHGIRRGRPGWRLSWGLAAVGLAVLWACSDELLQLFVPGRGSSLRDVLIDGFGAAMAQVIPAWWSAQRRAPDASSQTG